MPFHSTTACVNIICGHLEDNPGQLTSQQRQSPVSDKIFFSFTPSHIRNGSNVSVMYFLKKPWDFSVELIYGSFLYKPSIQFLILIGRLD